MGRLSQAGAAVLRLCAAVGPALLALLTVLYTGRPSPLYLAAGFVLAAIILACDAWIIARRHWVTGGIALITQAAFVIFIGGYAASPFPAPSPVSDPLPQPSPPTGMAVCVLKTGVNHRSSAFAYRGGSPWKKWDSVLNAVLVRHPQGDVLIDTGLGRMIPSQFEQMPLLFRLGERQGSLPACPLRRWPGSGKAVARFGLRMMPTFPPPPLKFRTSGLSGRTRARAR